MGEWNHILLICKFIIIFWQGNPSFSALNHLWQMFLLVTWSKFSFSPHDSQLAPVTSPTKPNSSSSTFLACRVAILGNGHPTLNEESWQWVYKPLLTSWWPSLPLENTGSLDPGTYKNIGEAQVKRNHHVGLKGMGCVERNIATEP